MQPDIERRKRKSDGERREKPAVPHPGVRDGAHPSKDMPARRKKGKRKKKSLWYHLSEAVDDIDDIFDFFD